MLRRHPSIAYFALANLITWGIEIPGILFAHERGIAFSNEYNFTMFAAPCAVAPRKTSAWRLPSSTSGSSARRSWRSRSPPSSTVGPV